jgi:hypothetical protein
MEVRTPPPPQEGGKKWRKKWKSRKWKNTFLSLCALTSTAMQNTNYSFQKQKFK